MGLNDTPSGERVHIGIFGKRNAGKSSLINALTNQKTAIVSDVKGTTTDPVYKAMEILPLGPVVIIDTPGTDDVGELGSMRIKAAKKVLEKTDIALVAADEGRLTAEDSDIISEIKKRNIPYIIVYTKSDIYKNTELPQGENAIAVSAETGENIGKLRELIASVCGDNTENKRIVGDLISKGDVILLVIPIDSSAPKGRLILPQQQVIRDILESGAFPVVTRDTELAECFDKLKAPPALVITDSQAFKKVAETVPEDIMLTSFSILMARYKGILKQTALGAAAADKLKDGDTVLISEGCTHHRQCEDIGTVKIPKWLEKYTGKTLNYKFTSGREFPDVLDGIDLVVHCGGCMLNEREVCSRMKIAQEQNIPMTNYGILIAYMNGILKRSVEIFKDIKL